MSLSNQIESNQTQQIGTAITTAEKQLGAPPGSFNILEDLTYLLTAVICHRLRYVAAAEISEM